VSISFPQLFRMCSGVAFESFNARRHILRQSQSVSRFGMKKITLIGQNNKVKKRVHLKGEIPSPIDPPAGSAFGHRIQHPRYEESIGMDLSMVEIEPDHWVAADPCCLSEEDFTKAQSLL